MRTVLRCLTILVLLACVLPLPAAQKSPERAEDLMIVDCLLPGQVRRLGRRATFMTPRRPIRTTSFDCRVRGGEFTETDRADYGTALRVWIEAARAGDAEAQYSVGRIYEQGLAGEPDYRAAVEWYGVAAAQNHSAAQISLGYAYEKGLGVETDPVAALQWYRRASGLPAEMVVLESQEYSELVHLREEIRVKEEEIERLRRELLERSESGAAQKEDLESRIRILRSQLEHARERINAHAGEEAAVTHAAVRPNGTWFALLIGNSDYRWMPSVTTARKSVERMATVLRDRFGFKVRILENATRFEVMSALNDLRQSLTERDHLLVFYSGHGKSDPETQRGWWLPVDAEPDKRANWLSNRVVSEHLDLIPARHVLVLADSCYEGSLTRSSIPVLPRGMTAEQRSAEMKTMLGKRARLALTSGEDAPRPGERDVSPFTGAVLEVLEGSQGVIEASAIYRKVNSSLSSRGSGTRPILAPIRYASHEGSDFFFFSRQ